MSKDMMNDRIDEKRRAGILTDESYATPIADAYCGSYHGRAITSAAINAQIEAFRTIRNLPYNTSAHHNATQTLRSMESWAPNSLSIQSFADHFGAIRLPPPPDRTKNTTTKPPSDDDIISCRLLHSLEIMRLSHHNISDEHNLAWAYLLLEKYGPFPKHGYEEWWDPVRIARRGPDSISSENDTCSYFKMSVLEPAIMGAIFLHAQHANLTIDQACGYPRGHWVVRDTSIIGSSGRADLTLFDPSDEPNLVAEGKTFHVCTGTDPDSALLKLPVFFHEHGESIPINFGTLSTLINGVQWKQKLLYFFIQNWHQLVSRNCHHSVVFNENEFVLCYRKNNTLLLSDVYPTVTPNSTSQKQAMVELTYFIADAMCQYVPKPASIAVESDMITEGSSHSRNVSVVTIKPTSNV